MASDRLSRRTGKANGRLIRWQPRGHHWADVSVQGIGLFGGVFGSVAFSTLAIAESRARRFTGMKCASVNAWPAIGHLKSDSFNRMAILRGIAPTTAGASAELV